MVWHFRRRSFDFRLVGLTGLVAANRSQHRRTLLGRDLTQHFSAATDVAVHAVRNPTHRSTAAALNLDALHGGTTGSSCQMPDVDILTVTERHPAWANRAGHERQPTFLLPPRLDRKTTASQAADITKRGSLWRHERVN